MNRSWIAAALAATALLTGCGNMETQPDQQGIRYSGGALFPEAITFKNCQGPSKQEFGDAGDNTFIYPAGQRTLKFSADPGSDTGPITVSAPSPGGGQPIELTVSGVVTFTPIFEDCETLRRFHETIGIKYAAWTPEGWARMVSVYLKDPTDRAADNEALKFNWVDLSSNADKKAEWERNVAAAIQGAPDRPGLIEQLAGGKFFRIDGVLLQRPDLPGNVKASIADTEAARQQAQTAEQVKQAAATFPGGVPAYQSYQQQQAVNEAIRSGNVKVIPVPQGSPVIVSGQ